MIQPKAFPKTITKHYRKERIEQKHDLRDEPTKTDGDIEPETLFTHANDHRRWRIAQTIERSGFNLCFGFNLYELLNEFY